MAITIGVDWGSSSFRAYRFDDKGQCIDSLSNGNGIKFVANGAFETVLVDHIGHWLHPGDTVLLSGMITSRNGWVESDYLDCPARLDSLMDAGRRVTMGENEYLFLPGVSQRAPADVMRGEELQLLGAVESGDEYHCVIPGTHSKWARVNSWTLEHFRSIPTGELFDVVLNHSLMGALASAGDFDEAAFCRGVMRGYESSMPISDLFTARSSVLMAQQNAQAAYHWLSGLLIGNEIREGLLMLQDTPREIRLIGSESLCRRYLDAFNILGMNAKQFDEYVTMRAYQILINQACSN